MESREAILLNKQDIYNKAALQRGRFKQTLTVNIIVAVFIFDLIS